MIECEDLSKQFGSFWAVDGVSLKVEPGNVLAILGQNGAGKTTTVRMLTAVLSPTRGWARIAGHDTTQHAEKVRTSVGVLTEQHGLYARMTGKEYLDYFARIYSLDDRSRKERSAYLLEYFGLSNAANQRTGEYSKGMRQKLALARALIHEPPALLLDEPTSAMDPESARLVREYILNLRSSHRAIIICTHNLIEAELLADKIAILYRGKILMIGSVDELRETIMGPSKFEVRMSHPFPIEALELPAGITIVAQDESGFIYEVATAGELNPVLIQELAKKNAPVISVQPITFSLEQVYLEVMKRVKAGMPL